MNAKWVKRIVIGLGLTIATTAMALTINGELKKARMENLDSDPTGTEGRFYFNTDTNLPKYYDGSNWNNLTADATALSQYAVDVGNSSGARTEVNTNLLGHIAGTVTNFSFVDGDVTTGSDSIAETSHGMVTGDTFYMTTTGVVPAGLSASTRYYAIRVDANNFKPASTLALAVAGTAVDITAAAGGGTHTVIYGGLNHLATWKPGVRDGSAATAGYVGEVISTGAMTNTDCVNADDPVAITGASITLTPGAWRIYYGIMLRSTDATAAVNNLANGRIRVLAGGSALAGSAMMHEFYIPPASGTVGFFAANSVPVNISATTTYTLDITNDHIATDVLLSARVSDLGRLTGSDQDPYFYAVRVR